MHMRSITGETVKNMEEVHSRSERKGTSLHLDLIDITYHQYANAYIKKTLQLNVLTLTVFPMMLSVIGYTYLPNVTNLTTKDSNVIINCHSWTSYLMIMPYLYIYY